jgi:hypothetical protein
MTNEEFRREYERLTSKVNEKIKESNEFVEGDTDPNRPGRDEEFADLQGKVKSAVHELEELWRQVRTGEIKLG